MTGIRLLRLLAIVTLVVIVISLVPFVAAFSETGARLIISLTEPLTQLLLVTGSDLGFATGIAALMIVAQQRRWAWLVALLLLVLAHMYVPVVALTIGPSQRWWILFGTAQQYLIVYLASVLGPAALTALVTVVLTLSGRATTPTRQQLALAPSFPTTEPR